MPNPNDYCGEPTYSKHPCELMRALNAIEHEDGQFQEVCNWDGSEGAGGEVDGIVDIAVDPNGAVFVTDIGHHRVVKYDKDGTYVTEWGEYGVGDTQFDRPWSICTGSNYVWVLDFGNEYIKRFSLDGTYQIKWALPAGAGWIRADENDNVYLVYRQSGAPDTVEVVVYDKDGIEVDSWTAFSGTCLAYPTCWVDESYLHIYTIVQRIPTGVAHYIRAGRDGSGLVDVTLNFQVGILNPAGICSDVRGRIMLSVSYYTGVCGDSRCVYIYPLTGVTDGGEVAQMGRSDRSAGINVFACDAAKRRYYVREGYVGTVGNTCRVVCYRRQTEWWRYTAPYSRVSAGEPDEGATQPGDEMLTGYPLILNTMTDLREAIERMVPEVKTVAVDGYPAGPLVANPTTGNVYNWADASADNLLNKAMGDRTKYGGVGVRYDWTRDRDAMLGQQPRDIEIGEIYECIETLEAADHL